MKSNINIEELMQLIPDYITGQIDENDKRMLESAMNESAELRELYNEMSGTLAFVNNIKFVEPSLQYWNALLPRIHERIEQQESKKFSWNKIPNLWKMLVPIAAVVIIALVYYLVKPSGVQMTKDENKIENINKDTNKDKIENNKEDNKLPENSKEGLVKEDEKHKSDDDARKDIKINKTDNYNLVKEETVTNDSNYKEQEPLNGDYTSDIDETSVFSTGEGAGLDYKTEDELKELSDTEQNSLLKQLEKSNL